MDLKVAPRYQPQYPAGHMRDMLLRQRPESYGNLRRVSTRSYEENQAGFDLKMNDYKELTLTRVTILSRRRPGFESPWGRHFTLTQNPCSGIWSQIKTGLGRFFFALKLAFNCKFIYPGPCEAPLFAKSPSKP